MNPFFSKFNTPHETFPFDKIILEDIEEAIREGIHREDEAYKNIAENPDAPTFENTIEALEDPGQMLSDALSVMYNLSSAETNDRLDQLVQKMSPIVSEHTSNFLMNQKLFARVKALHEHPSAFLSKEQRMLLEETYSSFERGGANLSPEDKEKFRNITSKLSMLTVTFSQHHLKATNAYELFIDDKSQLSGLPESQLTQAAETAKEKGKNGWLFTLKFPSYGPFMKYANNRDLRRKMYLAYNTQCTLQDDNNNFSIVSDIVNLRREMAQLLGYKTYADYALKHRMAETTDAVNHLLNRLVDAYLGPAKQDVATVVKRAEADGIEDFQPWDFSYYSHKLYVEQYDLDAELLRPYFELSAVKKGVFGLATRLYGITFKKNADIPVYHQDVDAYEVFDKDGSFLAVLYVDFFPRPGKQSGAWMTSYKDQRQGERPHVSIVMNFSKPMADKPALLTLGEVETFLHEFGHSLHGIFANTRYASLSGTHVYWDFVELPSQFMENYSVEPDFLKTFARHYQTGEPMPMEYIERIQKSRTFQAAYACMRQVGFGLLDMAYYTQEKPFVADVRQFESNAWKRVRLLPEVPECCMTVQFGHIMSGGYAAGYYSYKWAEVLDADAFSLFREKGIFDSATAQSFRDNVLSKGGTEPPMDLYVRFRGRKPSIDALMRRDGILK